MSENNGRAGWTVILRVLIGVFFAAALFVGAKSGVVLAKRHLPATVESESYPKGLRVTLEFGEGDALIGSESPKRMRDYFFVVDSGTMAEESENYQDMKRLAGRIDLEVVDEDIDIVKVKVRSGPQRDAVLWVHTRQLPTPGELRGKEGVKVIFSEGGE